MSNVFDSNQATFQQDVIQKSYETPVLVDFWAPWCGPCRMLGPVLERMANETNSGFVLAKVNSDHNQQLSMQYGVRGIPNVKAFVNGRLVDEFVGAQPEPMVRQFVQKLPKAQGSPAAPPKSAQPATDPTARLQQGRDLLKQGKGCEAFPMLNNFPASSEADAAKKLQPVAAYLCEASQGKISGSSDLDNTYRQAADALRRRDYSTGMYQLLTVIKLAQGLMMGSRNGSQRRHPQSRHRDSYLRHEVRPGSCHRLHPARRGVEETDHRSHRHGRRW